MTPPSDAQFPPIEAPGDTQPRPPMEPADPATPGARPPQQQRPPAAEPGTPPGTPGPPPAEPGTPPDAAIQGRVVLVGAAPMSNVVIRRDAPPDISLHGSASVMRGLRSVEGTTVQVYGHPDGATMHVVRFEVRAANGVPATDGLVRRDGDAWYLETVDGRRHRVAHLPEPLRREGQRVWVAGPLDGEPEAFGIIDG